MSAPALADLIRDCYLERVALLMRRLGRIEPAGLKISRALAEVMFASLDDDMRELGVGYLSVPKKMRKTAAAFYGRAAVRLGVPARYDPGRGIERGHVVPPAAAREDERARRVHDRAVDGDVLYRAIQHWVP